MIVVTPTEYVWPVDGHDICESCNYLTVVHTTYAMDDGSRVVPLCVDCATGTGETGFYPCGCPNNSHTDDCIDNGNYLIGEQ